MKQTVDDNIVPAYYLALTVAVLMVDFMMIKTFFETIYLLDMCSNFVGLVQNVSDRKSI